MHLHCRDSSKVAAAAQSRAMLQSLVEEVLSDSEELTNPQNEKIDKRQD
jgi:hypothetical protein